MTFNTGIRRNDMMHMSDAIQLQTEIQALCAEQFLAVLCTQYQGQPFGSLVAFTVSDDLRYLCFATERATRKYRNLTSEPRVALLIDSRRAYPDDLADACALTVIGRICDPGRTVMAPLQTKHATRHPQLCDFLAQPTTCLLTVTVEHYDLVSHFQHVRTLSLRTGDAPCEP